MTAKFFKVHFINNTGKQFGFCEFKVQENEVMGDVLERILYIASELTPHHRNWRTDLKIYGECLFTYHGLQDCVVEFRNGEFFVTDI